MAGRSVVAVAAVLALLPLGASARGVANDFSPSLTFTALVSTPGARSTEGLGFSISPFLSSDGGSPVAVELGVTLPAGVRWAASAPGSNEGCTRTEQEAVCTKSVPPPTGTNLAATYGIWQVVAEREGSYTFKATILQTSQPDPNTSNDSASMTVSVGTARGGVTLKPRLPKAGFGVVASHRVLILDNDGRTFPILKGTVACSARIGSAKAKAIGALNDGRASCRLKSPAGAKGKVVTGTIRTTSSGLVLTKQFRATLG